MHHLILVREIDQQMTGSRCCGRIEGAIPFGGLTTPLFPERRERMRGIGAIYRAVKDAFGERIQITVVDPRNFLSFLVLVLRDALRFHVPPGSTLRALGASSLSSGVFDGEVLFRDAMPTPDEVVATIAGRLEVHRVGEPATPVVS